MPDWCLQCVCQCNDLIMCARHTDTRENRDLLGFVEHGGKLSNIIGVGVQNRTASRNELGCGSLRLLVRHVTGNRHHCDTLSANRVTDRSVHDARSLLSGGNHFAVRRALHKKPVGVGLLEVRLSDLHAGNV